MLRFQTASYVIFFALLLPNLVGCGDGKPRPYEFGGVVTVDGQPAEGVRLTFYPEDPPAAELQVPLPVGYTDANGEFSASTYDGSDGAPAGKYQVTAAWMTEKPADADPESFESEDRLNGHYSDPTKSGIAVEVNAGSNEPCQIPLESKR